jgi:hypothetical protein
LSLVGWSVFAAQTKGEDLLTHLDPASSLAIGLLIFTFVLVIAFEASNGFHDTANAVATVIYTKSLPPVPAVIWSGLMNFLGVLIGGIAVAYALVELLPPEVLYGWTAECGQTGQAHTIGLVCPICPDPWIGLVLSNHTQ